MSSKTPPSQIRSQETGFGQSDRPNSYHGAYSPVRQARPARPRSIKGARLNRNWHSFLPPSPRPSPRSLNPTARTDVDSLMSSVVYPVRPGCINEHDLPSVFGSNSSSLSSKRSDSSESRYEANLKPQMSPRTREKTFTEIMNHAFDLRKSPMGLGRRLSSGGRPDGWLLQSPITPPSSCGESSFTRTSPMRSGKRVASSDVGPSFKQPKTESDSSPSSASRRKDSGTPDINGWDIPANHKSDSEDMALDAQGISKLVDIMRSNIRQSKELTDLFAKFIEQTTTDQYQRTSRSNSTRSQVAKPVKYTETPGSGSLSSVPGNGGDSPDPPRDPNPFRGHMIERQDITATDTESEDDQRLVSGCLDRLRVSSSPPMHGKPTPLGNGSISTVRRGAYLVSFPAPYLPEDVHLSLDTNDFSHGIIFPDPSPSGESRWHFENLDLAGENVGGENLDVAEDTRGKPSFSRQISPISQSDRDIRSDAPSPDTLQPGDTQTEHLPRPATPDCPQALQSGKKIVRFDVSSSETPHEMLSDQECQSASRGSSDEPEGASIPYQINGGGVQFDLPIRGGNPNQGNINSMVSDPQVPTQNLPNVEYSIRRQLCAALQTGAATPPLIRPPSPAFCSFPSNSSPIRPRAPPSSPLRP